ncbi:MAG: hypothetical protein PHI98_04600 [Eubacteriales bacterium]|nr:hypothetical protein [Eubacteriales bacterium]
MGWFNEYGFVIIVAIMIPNMIFAAKCKDGFDNLWQNRSVDLLEQIGRFGCFGLMIINIPGTWFGFWFGEAPTVYLIVNGLLVIAYCTVWVVCFHQNSVFRALTLSILPSIMFLFSGVMLLSIPLMAAAIIFAPCHIMISYQNALLSKRGAAAVKKEA